MNKPILLVSMCLLGIPCRYDGLGQARERVTSLLKSCTMIPICPEQLGGLATPRKPAERVGARILNQTGSDVTDAFLRGAENTLRVAELYRPCAALLKSRSPSCGSGSVYDGSFTGTLREGDGLTAEALKARGIPVFSEENIPQLIEFLKGNGYDLF